MTTRLCSAPCNRSLRSAAMSYSALTGASAFALAIEAQPGRDRARHRLPDADGRDVLGKLKADPRTAHIPVVVWSGRAGHPSDSRIALDLGAEDYVEKNDARFLILKVERVLLRTTKAPSPRPDRRWSPARYPGSG